MTNESSVRPQRLALMLGALGVVYGDIGTSPLYALRECFHGPHALAVSRDNVLGILSLVFWSLFLIVTIKYLVFVMRANSRGEGGILALLSLVVPDVTRGWRRSRALIIVGVFGAALLYGDGIITPAVTVLGAMEGLAVVTDGLQPYVVPVAIIVLILLFTVQRIGTGHVGSIFGPIMLVWFVSLAVLGVRSVVQAPEVLWAVNPLEGLRVLLEHKVAGFLVLGAVFLVVTGAEALYADMGHFGIQPIRRAWFFVVLPALLLNYFGQGALLLRMPEAASNPFYHLAPAWAVLPMVALATIAAVIASQALISGAYSLTMQALQLGFLPRMKIVHTSSATRGQIYMPTVNRLLMLACVGLVIGFRTSSNLASAYGVAVTLTMLSTSILFYFAARHLWGWSGLVAGSLCALFLVPEMAFFMANAVKFLHGGWFPMVVGLFIFVLMTSWLTGRDRLRQRLQAASVPLQDFLKALNVEPPVKVRGTAVYMAGNPHGTPLALLHNLKHNKVLHENVILLTVLTKEVPRVDTLDRLATERLTPGIYRVIGNFGFMEEPDVPLLLQQAAADGVPYRKNEATFFLSRETIVPTTLQRGMQDWRNVLFAFLSRNAQSATAFFQLPANRVVELGLRVEL